VTMLVDMPLNCIPETVDVEALKAKRIAATSKAWVDWAPWGGVVRGNSEHCHRSPQQEFPVSSAFSFTPASTALPGSTKPTCGSPSASYAETGLPLLAHAEVAGPVETATASLHAAGADWRKYSTYLASRPEAAEIEAIALLIRLAEEFQTHIHIVHLASAKLCRSSRKPVDAGYRSP